MYIFNTWYNIIETYIYNKTIQIPINMININTILLIIYKHIQTFIYNINTIIRKLLIIIYNINTNINIILINIIT